MAKKIIFIALRFILGTLFIVSAITKYLSIESFEMFILHYKFLSWDLATVLARLLISFEFIIGVLYISKLLFKWINIITFSTLLFFSSFLIFVIVSGTNIDNCNCFGTKLIMSPVQALIKNIFLMGITLVLRKEKAFTIRFQPFFISLFSVTMLALPVILTPPSFILYTLYHKDYKKRILPTEYIGEPVFSGEKIDLIKGKKMLVVLSLNCYHCEKAAEKISLIHARSETELPIYYVFGGDPERLEHFWQVSKSTRFPYRYVAGRDFLDLCKGRVPKIYLLNNGFIEHTYDNKGITEANILPFFKE